MALLRIYSAHQNLGSATPKSINFSTSSISKREREREQI